MKTTLCLPLACFLAAAGVLHGETDDRKPYDGEEDIANNPDAYAKDMVGTFAGAFGKRKITICVDRVIGQTATML